MKVIINKSNIYNSLILGFIIIINSKQKRTNLLALYLLIGSTDTEFATLSNSLSLILSATT